jgi:long-chain acyl-CoA synthetase
MGYTINDKNEKGEVTPRGELLLRGPCVMLGYYKRRDKTDEVLNDQGWYSTGDVAMLHPNTGCIKVFDRIGAVIKLQNGEFVSPEKVENMYVDVP